MTLLSPEIDVRPSRLCVLSAAAGLSACGGSQSTLVTAGRDAERIADLLITMAIGGLIVWAAVVAIAVYAILVRESHNPRAATLLIVGGGTVAPIVVLGSLIAHGMPLVPAVLSVPSDGESVIHVTAKQWWWRIQYQTPAGLVDTANELRLPVGERVALRLTSPDVIHSFWVPALAGKMDMIPGRVTRLALEPTRVGTFRGVCAEYCGASHALMAFTVIVMEPRDFRAWLSAQAQPAVSPTDPLAIRGGTAFVAHGCTACHTIRGTPAAGRIGPDLTHVGGRLRLAADTLPNEPAALVRWIRRADYIKPGVHMPAFRALDRDELSALAAYLDGLR
jgi:cytochrome c oxidase subunit 2